MEKFISPDSNTYQICKYAIEHNCDIVYAYQQELQFYFDVISAICDRSNGRYIIRHIDYELDRVELSNNNEIFQIRLYCIDFFIRYSRIGRYNPVVIDDIDKCLSVVMEMQGSCTIAAIAMSSYDPNDVALHRVPFPSGSSESKYKSEPQLQCRSLL